MVCHATTCRMARNPSRVAVKRREVGGLQGEAFSALDLSEIGCVESHPTRISGRSSVDPAPRRCHCRHFQGQNRHFQGRRGRDISTHAKFAKVWVGFPRFRATRIGAKLQSVTNCGAVRCGSAARFRRSAHVAKGTPWSAEYYWSLSCFSRVFIRHDYFRGFLTALREGFISGHFSGRSAPKPGRFGKPARFTVSRDGISQKRRGIISDLFPANLRDMRDSDLCRL